VWLWTLFELAQAKAQLLPVSTQISSPQKVGNILPDFQRIVFVFGCLAAQHEFPVHNTDMMVHTDFFETVSDKIYNNS
jgi:hypothetical protein